MFQVQAEQAGDRLRSDSLAPAILDEQVIGDGEMIKLFAVTKILQERSVDDLRVPQWNVIGPAQLFGAPERFEIP